MVQIGRPASTITSEWTVVDSTAHGATSDESDSTFIVASGNGQLNDETEVKFETLTDPNDDSSHYIYLRWQVVAGGGAPERIDLRVLQGAFEINAWDLQTVPDDITEDSWEITNANSITDYSDLRVEVVAAAMAGDEQIRVYEFWLSIPDAAAPVYNESLSEITSLQTAAPGVQSVLRLGIAENPSLGTLPGPQGQFSPSAVEMMSLLDEIQKSCHFCTPISERLSLSAEHKGQMGFYLGLDQRLSANDERKGQVEFALGIHEDVSLAKVMTAAFLMSIPLSQALSLIDKIVAEIEGPETFNETLLEQMSLSKQMKAAVALVLGLTDSWSIADLVSSEAISVDYLTETLTISDAMAAILTYYAQMRKELSLSDTLKTSVQHYLSRSEEASFSDIIQGVLETAGEIFNEAISEKLSFGHETAKMFLYALALAETVSVDKGIQAKIIFNMTVNNQLQLAEVMAAVFNFGLAITENLSAGEIIASTQSTIEIRETRRGKTYIFSVADANSQTWRI